MWVWIVNSSCMLGDWVTTSLGNAGTWALKSATDAGHALQQIGTLVK